MERDYEETDEEEDIAHNLPHMAEVITEHALHHQPHESALTHPEETAVGAPGEVLESAALEFSAETEVQTTPPAQLWLVSHFSHFGEDKLRRHWHYLYGMVLFLFTYYCVPLL